MAIRIIDYDDRYADATVAMWRASFERGVGVTDPHPLDDQLRFLRTRVVPSNRVWLAIDEDTDAVVGFLAVDGDELNHLYVHVDQQRRGLGTKLLDLAKAQSPGTLRLFAFDSNRGAQRFYEKHGFRIVARGFEPEWKLADIRYEWTRS